MTAFTSNLRFQQEATCEISKAGLKFTVEHSHALEAKAFFQAALFHDFFYCDDEPTSFSINLTVLLECLSVFGSSDTATLKLSYVGYVTTSF